MRILIQDSNSKAYFDGEIWIDDIFSAMDFENTGLAEKFCVEHKLSHALIVVKFKDDEDDIRFPVGARSGLLASLTQGHSAAKPQ